MGSLTQHKLPIIDFTKENLKPGTSSWDKTSKQVLSALEEYGCFVAVYDHEVSLELHDKVFKKVEELFELPTATKMQNKASIPLYGYVGQIPSLPLCESMGIDGANTLEGIQKFTTIMWPNGNDDFSETIHPFSKIIQKLEQMVVRMVFESYGLEKHYKEAYLKSASHLFRVMKYRKPEENESKMGLLAHTDKTYMSIIHQKDEVDGLEIKAKDGQWFGVELSPSSFVVMAGEVILAWSNDRLYAPSHRVTMKGDKDRYTLAQFSMMKEIVETPEELVDQEHPSQFKPFDHFEYLEFYGRPENRMLESAIRTYCGI